MNTKLPPKSNTPIDRRASSDLANGRALSTAEEAQLRTYAQNVDRPISWVIRQALRHFIVTYLDHEPPYV